MSGHGDGGSSHGGFEEMREQNKREKGERRDMVRVLDPFASLPLIIIILFSQMHHLAFHKRTKT